MRSNVKLSTMLEPRRKWPLRWPDWAGFAALGVVAVFVIYWMLVFLFWPSFTQGQDSLYQDPWGETGVELDLGGGLRSRSGRMEYRYGLEQGPVGEPADPC